MTVLFITDFFLDFHESFLNLKEVSLNLKEVFLNLKDFFLNIKEVSLNVKEVFLNIKEAFLTIAQNKLDSKAVKICAAEHLFEQRRGEFPYLSAVVAYVRVNPCHIIAVQNELFEL